MLPVYPPVYASLLAYYLAVDMVIGTRIKGGTRGLKVPCSATELLAQAPPRVYPIRVSSSTLQATLLVKEMSVSGEDHCETVAVGGPYDFVVADGASGLDDRAYSGFG